MSPSVVTRSLGGREWQVHAALPDAVAALCASDLDRLAARPDVELIRDKRLRRTVLVPCGDTVVLVKEIKGLSPRARIRSWFRGRPIQREWTWAWRFAEAGVTVPQPWAMHDGGVRGTSWFMQEGIPGAQHLVPYFAERLGLRGPTRPAALWRTFVSQVGSMLAAVHAAGANHPDIHSGNVLCTGATPDDLRLYLVDYHSARAGWGGVDRYRVANLAKFFTGFGVMFDRADLLEILDVYLARAPETGVLTAPALADAIERRMRGLMRHTARSRMQRARTNSSRFVVERRGDLRVWRRRECEPGDLDALLARIAQEEAAPHKEGDRSRVHRGELPRSGLRWGPRVWVKSYDHPGVAKQVEAWLGRAPGRRAWAASEGLVHLQIHAAHAVAYVERWRGGRLAASHLVTNHMPHRIDLDRLLFLGSRVDGDPARLRDKRSLIDTLGRLVRRLHDAGVYHKDLSAKNVLVDRHPTGHWLLILVDLDSVSLPPWGVDRRRRRKNLAQLTGLPSTITGRDRLRFYAAYCGGTDEVRAAMDECEEIMRLGAKTQAFWRTREVQARENDWPGPHRPAAPLPERQ